MMETPPLHDIDRALIGPGSAALPPAERRWARPRPALAAFVLRIALGLVLLLDGFARLQGLGVGGPADGASPWLMFALPAALFEVLGSILVLGGSFVTPLAWLAALHFGIVALAAGGAWQVPAFLVLVSVAAAFAGPGAAAMRIETLPPGRSGGPHFMM
jgi:uncharacterized membrane protein YphA (DoxX/SURF4 family)